MKEGIFMHLFKEMPEAIRITFLQIVLILLDLEHSVKLLLD